VKTKVIIALVVVVAIAGLVFGRSKAIENYSKQTAIAEQKGDYAKAIKEFNKIVFLEKIVPFNSRITSAYIYRGRLYFNNGNVNQALEDLNAAIKIDKKSPEAHFGIGLIRLQEGDLKEAEKEFTLVIKERPKWIEPYLSRQVAYRKLGEKDKAMADLKKVLEIDPENEAAKNAMKIFE